MSSETLDTQQPQSASPPDFIAYQVIDRGEGQKSIWRAIGSAWTHNDGNGIQLRLDAMPLDGSISLRVPLPPKSGAHA